MERDYSLIFKIFKIELDLNILNILGGRFKDQSGKVRP